MNYSCVVIWDHWRRCVLTLFKDVASFTDAERSIYSYILSNKEKVVLMRVRELADATHTSPATVLRFTQKMGYESFIEFKLAVKAELQRTTNFQFMETREVIESFSSRMLNDEYENKLNEVAKVITNGQFLIFFGIGTSGILAEYGSRIFSNFGKRTSYIKDPFYPLNQMAETFENTIAFVLSASGETFQTLHQAQVLKERGAILISITNSSYNTLAKMSDINLSYHIPSDSIDGVINTTSQLPVMYLLETLAKKSYYMQHMGKG